MVSEADWHPQQAGILKIWGEVSATYRYLHFMSYHKYKKMSMRFTIPIIIISTVTGTANFAQGTFPVNTQSTVPLIIGGLNLVAAIATTLAQFLKVNELMEAHRVSAATYGKMSRHMRLELSLPPEERSMSGHEFINMTKLDMDRLIEQSPLIPGDILRMFEKKFPKEAHRFARPEILDIREITPYSEDMHEKMNTSSADRIRKAAARFFSTKNIDYDVPPPSPGFSQVSFAPEVFEPESFPPTFEERQVAETLQGLRQGPTTESDEENTSQV
jgi:hypothetical protein